MQTMKIGIIGSGWYGAHIALALKKKGYDVTLYEKGPDIFGNISSKFGIRLHRGPHYPRSHKTRESCQRGFDEFCKTYPELFVDLEYSIYGLGRFDSSDKPSHVNYEKFNAVCHESGFRKEIRPEDKGYTNLISAWDIEEPSLVLGDRLRNKFKKYLSDAGVIVKCNHAVKELKEHDGKVAIAISNDGHSFNEKFDYIINATSYQALLPDDVPFDFEPFYQVLSALVYEDTQSTEHPFSLIMMDGLFPCLMPYIDSEESGKEYFRKYIITHAKWTTLATCKTVTEANDILASITDNFIEKEIKPRCETEMAKFWPDFTNRFKYVGWKGSVLAKLKTDTEFRSAVTFEKDHVIHIVPGKVSNIFDAEREVEAIITNQNILNKGKCRYVKDGVLHESMNEIIARSNFDERNTCSQQTFKELLQSETDKNIAMFKSMEANSVPTKNNTTVNLTLPLDQSNTSKIERIPVVCL